MDIKAGKRVRKRGKKKLYFPEEIITNILIRLPVKSLFRFKLVCKKWRDEISSRDFADLHRRSSIPVMLVASARGERFELFALDKWWDLSRKRTVIHRFPSFVPEFPEASLNRFSHSGLIVLKGSRFWKPKPTYIILNPARPSDECVTINYSKDFLGNIHAVYYHPTLEEYCTLWWIHIPGGADHHPEQFQYKLLHLGSNPSFKMISDAFTYRIKDPRHPYPLLINDHLYWVLESEQASTDGHNDILEFDIINEQFMVIPCPIPLSTECKHYQTHLLNGDGFLSFLLILKSTVTIWALKDRELRLWSATEYTINISKCRISFGVIILACVDGMLAIESLGRLYVCNLREGTIKKYPNKYGGEVLFLSHQMSMPSLKNCKDGLYIDEDGEVCVQNKEEECGII